MEELRATGERGTGRPRCTWCLLLRCTHQHRDVESRSSAITLLMAHSTAPADAWSTESNVAGLQVRGDVGRTAARRGRAGRPSGCRLRGSRSRRGASTRRRAPTEATAAGEVAAWIRGGPAQELGLRGGSRPAPPPPSAWPGAGTKKSPVGQRGAAREDEDSERFRQPHELSCGSEGDDDDPRGQDGGRDRGGSRARRRGGEAGAARRRQRRARGAHRRQARGDRGGARPERRPGGAAAHRHRRRRAVPRRWRSWRSTASARVDGVVQVAAYDGLLAGLDGTATTTGTRCSAPTSSDRCTWCRAMAEAMGDRGGSIVLIGSQSSVLPPVDGAARVRVVEGRAALGDVPPGQGARPAQDPREHGRADVDVGSAGADVRAVAGGRPRHHRGGGDRRDHRQHAARRDPGRRGRRRVGGVPAAPTAPA